MNLRERLERYLDEKQQTVINVAREAQVSYDTLRKFRVRHRKGSPEFLSKLNKFLNDWGY